MYNYRALLLIVIALMLLPACASDSNRQVVAAQAADPTATPVTEPTITAPQPEPTLPPEQPTITATTLAATATPTDSPVVPDNPPETCPLTMPPDPSFIPPEPYPPTPPGDYFWYGSESLWVAVPADGVWAQLPDNPDGYTQKIFWWREGYYWIDEPEPQLTVTGRRLDDSAPPLKASRGTNAFAEDIQSAMLVGVSIPTLGCWEITGQYADSELSFVVWVAP